MILPLSSLTRGFKTLGGGGMEKKNLSYFLVSRMRLFKMWPQWYVYKRRSERAFLATSQPVLIAYAEMGRFFSHMH